MFMWPKPLDALDEQHELGKFWKEIGAPLYEADVRYYPDELELQKSRAFIAGGRPSFKKKERQNVKSKRREE